MIYQNVSLFQKYLKGSFPNGLLNCYLVVAANHYDRMKMEDTICRFLPHESGFSLMKIDCEKAVFHDVLSNITTPSLFGKEQVTVLDDISLFKKEEIKLLLQAIEQGNIFGRLVLGSKAKETIAVLYKMVEKRGAVLDLLLEKPWEKEKRLAEFIVEKCAQAKKTISLFIAKELLRKIGTDMASVEHEVEKLLVYVDTKTNIEKEDVDKTASSTNNATFWQLAEKIVWEGNVACLDNIFIDSTFFQGLIIAIRYQLQLGFKIVSFLEAGKSLEEHIFRLNAKALAQKQEIALKLKSSFFKNGIKLLFTIELLSKSGVDDFSTLINYFSCKAYYGK